MHKFLVAFILVGLCSSALAETYTLSPPSDLDSCNEEFENVANSLQPGDELILNDGVYSQSCARRLTVNGTPEAPIVIRAADGASPLITRPNATSATNNNIELTGSHFTIRGLRFQYGSSGVRFMGSDHITFENNKIYDTLNNALTMNSAATDSHIIRNNEIYNTGLALGDTEGEGMYIGDHNGGSKGTNHLIENNYIHDLRGTSSGGNDGIEIKFGSGGNIIRGNVIHDTNIGQQFPCIFVYGHGDQPNIIENNLVYNCGEAILVTADAIIRNNVILNSSINGIHLRLQSPAPNIQNVTIVNNTVYGSHPVCAHLRIGSAPNIVVANNAFYCNNSTAIAGDGFANATFSRNVIRGSLLGVSIDGSQFIQGTPASLNFVNAALQDFRLIEGSALIDAGDSTAPDMGTADFAGESRIMGSSVDVGAYEYSSSSPTSPTLVFDGPGSVTMSDGAVLTWNASNATSCEASGGWQGAKSTSGSETTAPLTATTEFTLTCTGDGGSVSESVTVNVNPVDVPPTLTFQAPVSVVENTSAQLTWSATDATSCIASGGWQGTKPVSGSESTSPLSVTTEFTLTCTGDGGSVVRSLTVSVTPNVVPPTLTFEAPASVVENTSAQLTWSATDATSCAASGGWQGTKPVSGSESTPLLTVATDYTLTCTGPGGIVSQSLTVDVIEIVAPPTLTFEGPSNVEQNSPAQLTWSSSGATSCIASGGWQGSRPTSGSESTRALTESTSFTLTCSGPGGTVAESLLIEVVSPLSDSDGDGLIDTWELQYFGDLSEDADGDPDRDEVVNLDEFNSGTDPQNGDTDGDGLTDGQEVTHSTNPLNSDTDNDGSTDFEEVQAGSDPIDSSSKPLPPVSPPDQQTSGSSGGGGTAHPVLILALFGVFLLRRRKAFR